MIFCSNCHQNFRRDPKDSYSKNKVNVEGGEIISKFCTLKYLFPLILMHFFFTHSICSIEMFHILYRNVFRPKSQWKSLFLRSTTEGPLKTGGIDQLMTRRYTDTDIKWPSGTARYVVISCWWSFHCTICTHKYIISNKNTMCQISIFLILSSQHDHSLLLL